MAEMALSAADRAALVQSMLFANYPDVGKFLDYGSPFQLLVAVVLSARCLDSRVNSVTATLFTEAPTAEKMAAMELSRLEDIVHPLGFFRQKARAILGLAQKIVNEFSGAVPLNFCDLPSLPGVGHKTASVVIGQLTDIPTFPVDTHVWRLSLRWGLSHGKNAAAVERDLKNLFHPKSWMGLHMRMIHHGKLHCTASGCGEVGCEICRRLRSSPWL